MSDIESRYRTVLLWYPSTWREENADVVLGTLMDEADATGRVRPRLTELVSLALNGIRARTGHLGTVSAETRDRLATLAFGTGFALTLIMFFGTEYTPWAPVFYEGWAGGFGPFHSAAFVINVLWFIATVLAFIGLRVLVRVVLLLTVPLSLIAIALIDTTPALWGRPPATVLVFLSVLAVLACVGRPGRHQLGLASTAVAFSFAALVLVQHRSSSWGSHGRLDSGWNIAANGLWPVVIFGLAFVVALVGDGRWGVALVALGSVWAGFSAIYGYANHPDTGLLAWVIIGVLFGISINGGAMLLSRGYRLQVVKKA